jgi:hypothetical protein
VEECSLAVLRQFEGKPSAVGVAEVLPVFGMEEPFLTVPVGGVATSVPDRLPFAMNLISAEAI